MTMLLGQLEQIDHLSGSALLSMPLDERLLDLIEARWPQAGLPLEKFSWIQVTQAHRGRAVWRSSLRAPASNSRAHTVRDWKWNN